MSDYQKNILDRVKDRINEWLETLKQKQPELLLTRQWRIIWLKGFHQGQNIMPVITSCKDGEYLIGEIQMVLPPSLELDLEAVELALKEEPYEVSPTAHSVPSLDDPLDLLNELVVGINGFLSGMPVPTVIASESPNNPASFAPLKVHVLGRTATVLPDSMESVKTELLKSPHLPEWFKAIESGDVRQGVLTKLAEGYTQYNLRKGYAATIKEFFKEYSDALLRQNKLYHHCPYKGRGVEIDYRGHCQEAFCSKKPHNSPCPVPSLRFGAPDQN